MRAAKLFLILVIYSGLTNLNAQTWVQQSNPGVGAVRNIKVLSNDTVFAQTNLQILKTVNGGTNWQVNHVSTQGGFSVWSWVTHSLCYAGVWWDGGYYKTTNGGNNWEYFGWSAGYRLMGMQFMINPAGDTVGFKIGEYQNGFSITTTGGRTWNTFAVPGQSSLNTLYFFNDQTGWVSGHPGIVSKTTDRGFTWTIQSTSHNFKQFYFLSENIGYATHVENPQNVYKTTNGGTNWTIVQPPAGYIGGMYFHDVNSGWVGRWADNGLFKTTNGGTTWAQQNLGLSGVWIQSISFVGYNCGWCAGHDNANNSLILKSTNGSGVLAPIAPTLISPPNNSTGQSITPLLDWDSLSTATFYRIQFSADSLFNTTIRDSNVTIAQYQVAPGLLTNNVKYFWRVNATNIGGTGPYSAVWNFRTGLVGITQSGNEIPKAYSLSQNYPNPFNPTTKIRFDISGTSVAQTFLSVYDMLGREVATLVNEELKPGTYEVEWSAEGGALNFVSGVYFYKIVADGFTDTKRMVLIK